MYRIIDLSLTVKQSGGDLLTVPTLPIHIEHAVLKKKRIDPQNWLRITPYRFNNGTDQVGMDLMIGDNLPHTHAESLLMNAITVRGELAPEESWAKRDIANIPAAEFVNWASIVDLADDDVSGGVGRELLMKRGQHIQEGDYVIIRANSDLNSGRRPYMLLDAAQWLVEKLGIVAVSMDFPPDIPGTGSIVHTYFYRKAILMIDQLTHLERLQCERVFFVGGVVLKTEGIGSSPARPIAFIPEPGPIWQWRSIDLFRPIPVPDSQRFLSNASFERTEPLELQEAVYKRYQIRALQILQDESKVHGGKRSFRDFGSPIRMISSHVGTHLLTPFCPLQGSNIPQEFFVSPGELPSSRLYGHAKLFDVSDIGPKQTITCRHLERSNVHLEPEDIALVATGYSDYYYETDHFLAYSPGFSPDAIEWFIAHKIKMLVVDTATVEESNDSTLLRKNLGRLFENNIPVVLAATNLWMTRSSECSLICSPLPMAGLDAAPARLIAIEEL